MISVVTLLAYDYRMAFENISSYYDIADEIIMGVDTNRHTFSGQPFEFDPNECRQLIQQHDPRCIIHLVQRPYVTLPHPMQNEVAERNDLSYLCTPGNWIISLDADEHVLHAKDFVWWLAEQRDRDIQPTASLTTVYKQIGDMLLVVNGGDEVFPVGTMLRCAYTSGRSTGQRRVASPLHILHYSWGRAEEQLRQKLTNWGHAKDIDAEKALTTWRNMTLDNYMDFTDLNPLDPQLWPRLKAMQLSEFAALAQG